MEALTVDRLPHDEGWAYEPKWDGFRCLAFRDGEHIELQSKSEKPLGRYFPDVIAAFAGLDAERFVLDGEIVVPMEGSLSFEHLLQRIHPAESRVKLLARETPAVFIAFDILAAETGDALTDRPFSERREALEGFAGRFLSEQGHVRLSPQTLDADIAEAWLQDLQGGLDGIVAKQRDLPYLSGERAMRKVKKLREADCVVGGFRYGKDGKLVGSLLLGLYDAEGLLHHVGFTSGIARNDKPALTERLEALIEPPGFTGRAPGGPSRWQTERSAEWQPLRNDLVAEVQYDHFSEGRFRHGTRLLRFRPDKAARTCTLTQVERRMSPPPGTF